MTSENCKNNILYSTSGMATGIGVYIAMLLIGMMASVILYHTLMSEKAKKNEWVRIQSFYMAQAAAEYALKKVNNNQDPSVSYPGKNIENGSFTISYSEPVISIQGKTGDGLYALSVKKPSMADCTPFDTSSVQLDSDDKIHHINFKKECLGSTQIDKAIISWTPNNGQQAKAFRIDNNYKYQAPPSPLLSSGNIMELQDFTLNDDDTYAISKIEFNAPISGATFTMSIIFSDGSQTAPLTFTPH